MLTGSISPLGSRYVIGREGDQLPTPETPWRSQQDGGGRAKEQVS